MESSAAPSRAEADEAPAAAPAAAPAEPQAASASGRRPRVLLAVSGSVASIKLPILAALLLEFCEVKVRSGRLWDCA